MENIALAQPQENPLVKALSFAFPSTKFDFEGDLLTFSVSELNPIELKNIETLATVYRMEVKIKPVSNGMLIRLKANGMPELLEHCKHPDVALCIPLEEILSDYQDFDFQPEKDMNDDPEEGTRFERCQENEASVFAVYGIRIFEDEKVPELIADCITKEAAVKLVQLLKNQKGK